VFLAGSQRFAYSGTFCVRLRDNTSQSRLTSDPLDLTSYEELKIDFWLNSDSMAVGDSFDLKVRDSSGSYIKVATFSSGTDFVDGQMTFKSVTIKSTQVALASNSIVRFECESPENSDRIYLDDIEVLAR
jgi:hypothetical protein